MKNQKKINEKVALFVDWHNAQKMNPISAKRLRTCSAMVFDCGTHYILRSYHTLVAAIRKDTGDEFDFLRMVYGYTNTSAQHIAKFFNDYGNGGKRYTWRNV